MSNQHLERDSFLFGPNGPFIADLHARFLDDPGSVDPSWQGFFRELGEDGRAVIEELRGASWTPRAAPLDGDGAAAEAADSTAAVAEAIAVGGEITAEDVRAATVDSIRALMLIRAYRVRGHLEADLDPLGVKAIEPHPELDPLSYGFTEEDFDRPIFINHVLGLETATLNEIVKVVRETYCGR
ncbi:MAG: 2-oxoglutarate dehydrogenase E1 component, partial [Proteobacteria bacterium]|nr:2-oxoglutarate dehydrogenase E1 component [Pseudomonadota bacterium]